jgi:hypothetical protein
MVVLKTDHVQLPDAVLTNSSAEVRPQAAVVAMAVGCGENGLVAACPALPVATKPCPLSTVHAECCRSTPNADRLRRSAIDRLGAPRQSVRCTFASYWDFVRHAKEQRLDLDFTTPPKRPAQN